MVLVSSVALTGVSSIAVLLRFISRGRILHILGPTDWFMAVTLVFAFANVICVGKYVVNGLGQPFAELPLEKQRSFFKIQYIVIIFNYASLILTKLSVLLLFLDVFLVTWIRKATYFVTFLVIIYGLWTTMSNIFICIPINTYWDLPPDSPDRNCIDPLTKWFIDTTINTIFDFVLLFLPMPGICTMTLPWRQKLWLHALFVLGLAVCVIAVLRFVFFEIALAGNDPSLAGVEIVRWATVEINLSIVIACIPTLKPLAVVICPRLVRSKRGIESDERPPTISSTPHRLESVESIPL